METNAITSGIKDLTGTYAASQAARVYRETGVFQQMLDTAQGARSGGPAAEAGRLNGDYTSGFTGAFTGQGDKTARPQGAAAPGAVGMSPAVIDKTSTLYEKSLELESYFVKIMLSTMRSSIGRANLGEQNKFAREMYEDMLYDELAVGMTKNAGFGLADQLYLELNRGE
ncbi:MAG: rod-binding protein [Spirochaetaceae bacterium]|jgi:flagellar protein FlgJ|nr:rod-binding protein [Spirochaetaceae bacterium]